MMVDRTGSVPKARIGTNRFVNIPLGTRYRIDQRLPPGESAVMAAE